MSGKRFKFMEGDLRQEEEFLAIRVGQDGYMTPPGSKIAYLKTLLAKDQQKYLKDQKDFFDCY